MARMLGFDRISPTIRSYFSEASTDALCWLAAMMLFQLSPRRHIFTISALRLVLACRPR
jgi:hypothetical protein